MIGEKEVWRTNAVTRRNACGAALAWGFAATLLTGCGTFQNKVTTDRLDHGLTIILPGIEGSSFANTNIARGLESGDVETAIEVHDWTTGFAPLMLLHLRDGSRHRDQADRIAQKIMTYQTMFPGRPVYLIGHSGGGAMALLTLRALPEPYRVTAVFLLAPAISPGFPIDEVLPRTTVGIWNYYSPLDAPLLIAGTAIAGTVDGRNTPAAGAIGFSVEEGELDLPGGPRLVQVPYSVRMLLNRHPGGHFGWTDPSFVRNYIATVINDTALPAGRLPAGRLSAEPVIDRGTALPVGYQWPVQRVERPAEPAVDR